MVRPLFIHLFIYLFFFWVGGAGGGGGGGGVRHFKNISLISSRSCIEGGRKPVNNQPPDYP